MTTAVQPPQSGENIRLLDAAYSTLWAITGGALSALKVIYRDVLAHKANGPLTDEIVAQIYQAHAGLSGALHLRGGMSYSLMTMGQQGASRPEGTRYVTLHRGVAVLDLIGPIFPRANLMTMSGATSLQRFMADFDWALNDEGVKSIIFNIDSPGGDVRGLAEAAQVIYRARGKKRMTSQAFGQMCSAAYFIGSAADDIIGDETSIIGSIGAMLCVQKNADPEQSEDVEFRSAVSPNKNADPLSPEGAAQFQQLVDDSGEIFVKTVARYRGISREDVLENYGKGSIMMGQRAKESGMIDKVGTLSSTFHLSATGRPTSSRITMDGGNLQIAAGPGTTIVPKLDAAVVGVELMGILDKWLKTNEEVGENGPAANSAATVPDVPKFATGHPVITMEQLIEKFGPAAATYAMTQAVAEKKIWPADQEEVGLEHMNAAIDDYRYGGEVTFVDKDGKQVAGTRVAQVEAKYARKKAHTMTDKAIKTVETGKGAAHALPEKTESVKTSEPTKESLDELLLMSQFGQQVYAARQQSGQNNDSAPVPVTYIKAPPLRGNQS